ncbi:MAG: hypothetical protein V1678_03390 [Candidatus Aenigmatarchaeota archaeon]
MSVYKVRGKDKFLVISSSVRRFLAEINRGKSESEKIRFQDLDYVTNIPIRSASVIRGSYCEEGLKNVLSNLNKEAEQTAASLSNAWARVSLYEEKRGDYKQ